MTLIHNTFKRPFWQGQGTAVQGTWSWNVDASQTDYASLTGEGAGTFYNHVPSSNLDEYKWSNIFLTKGSYKITVVGVKDVVEGIMEMLFGTTSLGTNDMYAAVITYNQIVTFTFTLAYDGTQDMRIRVNGKSGTDYYCEFSRFVIEKTG